jgi:hypothetical protein
VTLNLQPEQILLLQNEKLHHHLLHIRTRFPLLKLSAHMLVSGLDHHLSAGRSYPLALPNNSMGGKFLVTNSLRYQRDRFARPIDIMARFFVKHADLSGRITPSDGDGARWLTVVTIRRVLAHKASQEQTRAFLQVATLVPLQRCILKRCNRVTSPIRNQPQLRPRLP